ncbi:TetR/AcrR family transcriptional regulator [Nocardioides hwasunensis]|uniref:TetR/AcrR family transcriptional regulator n=1 Tax=Nocardioides hwasunensis TaxID=397258 RepID=A0ABR8MKA5_9ACTN|nr:TetR/AcrR family transcriptional regulator [Nocardioides hwasunensis]MBD3916448.1 TetR/AcrR family transcriptional regulator [Nocardioides hwasunensis]
MNFLCRPASAREQRHDAIVEAARALASEHGAGGFTVDQVAALAGVSRRTVFNHFAGVDQLLVAVCDQILAEVIDELLVAVDRLTTDLPPGEAGARAALDALCEATRGVDLPTAIVSIHQAIAGPEAGHDDDKVGGISRAAFEHVMVRLSERLSERAPDLDPLDLELTLTLLTNGLAAVGQRWAERHDVLTHDVPPAARADWDHLVDRLLHLLRVGHSG